MVDNQSQGARFLLSYSLDSLLPLTWTHLCVSSNVMGLTNRFLKSKENFIEIRMDIYVNGNMVLSGKEKQMVYLKDEAAPVCGC